MLVRLIGVINPELATEIDAAFKARDVQAVKDKETLADVATIEDRVIAREAEVAADQKVIEQNAAEISESNSEAKRKLIQVEKATSIEEVLKVK